MSDLQTIREDDERVIESRKSAGDMLEIADVITLDSHEMATFANDTLSSIQTAVKELEARKASVLDPLNAAVKATRALFRPAEDALDAAKVTLKRKLAEWFDQQERLRLVAEREAQARQQQELQAAQTALVDALVDDKATEADRAEAIARAAAADVAPAFAPIPVTDMGANSGGKRWKAEIADLPALLRYLADDAASAAPRFPKTVEIKIGELQRFASATSGTVAVPGVRFVQATSITARSA